ncbi:MAG TPA: helicase HerA-like domain-containing protein [Reyranella sp.]|nr:helicase HerA-like domain-containing protein [Reyranella sp.]
MADDTSIFVGAGDSDQHLLLKYGNRHGLIAGATGTGKTVSLQTLAEGFSTYGVPVFMADVKGDLSGISQPGGTNPRALERARQLGIDGYAGRAFPTIFWDLFGAKGHPVRTTVSEIGPVLMARLLQLNATQEGVLNIVFKVADEQGLLLLDFKDLQAVLQWTAENAGDLTTRYGNVGKSTVGIIQRALLTLEQQGGEQFFGEPALDLKDMIRTDATGLGCINVLAADKLMESPKLYSTFLLWLLSELFQVMPEVGDVDKPRFVFFFDEAHLLFDDAPKALLDKIEQVVRLIRSKGVGVYFISQNPIDIPEAVLGQLSNRVQHALRAFTPRDQKAVRTAAETFRPNSKFSAAEAIVELGVGEALVSFLDAKGVPTPVERCFVAPPRGRIGPATDAERAALIKASPLAGKYEQEIDRESAYEVLTGRATSGQVPTEAPASAPSTGQRRRGQYDAPPPVTPPPTPTSGPWGSPPPAGAPPTKREPRLRQSQPPEAPPPASRVPKTPASRGDTITTTIVKSAARTATNIAVREASKAIFGSGRNSGILGQILRGTLGGIVK